MSCTLHGTESFRNCMVCNVSAVSRFQIQLNWRSMQLKTIANQSRPKHLTLEERDKAIEENKMNENIGNGQFRCSKCERVVSNNDMFNQHMEYHPKKTCKHCAILHHDKK